MNTFIQLEDLEVYKLSLELSKLSWLIYNTLSWQDKKTMGDQFLSSTDSVGANISEGYFRFHYLDRIKFYYNARGSLAEASCFWLNQLLERGKISKVQFIEYSDCAGKLKLKLNNFIHSSYKAKIAEKSLNK